MLLFTTLPSKRSSVRVSMLKRWTAVVCSGVIGFSAMAVGHAAEVNIYSARKENLIKPLLDKFTEETRVEVNLVTGKADALLHRLKSEGKNSPADLFITVDAGRLHRAKASGVLQRVSSKALNQAVPAHLRDQEGFWYGLSVRARPIFYVKDRVDPAQLSSYEALAEKQWRGRICIRSSSNIYNQSLIASMLAHQGEKQVLGWTGEFVSNFAQPPVGGDRDQIKAAAAGVCDIAIANTYYFGQMLSGRDQAQKEAAEKVSIFWPNQSGRGAHVNVSGIGLTAAAQNREAAIKLMEFLVSEEAQAWYGEVNFEYPVRKGVAISPALQQWGTFKADTLNLTELGEFNQDAVKVMDKAGWR